MYTGTELLTVAALLLAANLTAQSVHSDSGRPAVVIYNTNTLGATVELWRGRDGAEGQELSQYWCEFAQANPSDFFATMQAARPVFDEWLGTLATAFRDFGGCVDLECRRKNLIAALNGARVRTGDALRTRLIERLKEVKATRVE